MRLSNVRARHERRRTGRISLAMDTSGSIDGSLLRRFDAEVAAVLIQTEPLLHLIVCDSDVHQILDVKAQRCFCRHR